MALVQWVLLCSGNRWGPGGFIGDFPKSVSTGIFLGEEVNFPGEEVLPENYNPALGILEQNRGKGLGAGKVGDRMGGSHFFFPFFHHCPFPSPDTWCLPFLSFSKICSTDKLASSSLPPSHWLCSQLPLVHLLLSFWNFIYIYYLLNFLPYSLCFCRLKKTF